MFRERAKEHDVLPWCDEHRVALVAYSVSRNEWRLRLGSTLALRPRLADRFRLHCFGWNLAPVGL